MREEEIYHIKEILESIESNTWKDEPDYWDKLKHQAAIAAMQGLLGNNEQLNYLFSGVLPQDRPEYLAKKASDFATALVEKYKHKKL